MTKALILSFLRYDESHEGKGFISSELSAMVYVAGMLCIQKRVYLQMRLISPAAGCEDCSQGWLSALSWSLLVQL